LKDLYLTILILTSITLNIIALMIVSNLIREFINPYILLVSGLLLFLIVGMIFLRKK